MATSGNMNYGWFSGGQASTIHRISYSADLSTSSIRGSLTIVRSNVGGTGNNDYGWIAGGSDGADYLSSVDRIEYANDSTIATVRGPLSLARTRLSGVGNISYGWFAGGFGEVSGSSNDKSTVDRIDYVNDSNTASVRGPLTYARTIRGTVGNPSYGWVGGDGSTSIDRIEYSNDLVTASSRGKLSLARQDLAATGGFPG
jgi:hypothetical protein